MLHRCITKMYMTTSDYRIRSVSDDGIMLVLAHMSGISLSWPSIIQDEHGKTYMFRSNEFMEQWMVGDFSGYAKYILKA